MGLTGDLQGFGLPELLQILALGKKTGILMIAGDMSEGRLTLLGGRLVDARAGETCGENAFFELLENVEGRFSFSRISTEEAMAEAPTIARALDVLLLEGSVRDLDEALREM